MKYKKYDFESYTIHTIKTDKFKNCSMEIILRNKIKKESITKWNFLCDMLMHSSKRYPKRKDIVIKLEDLYNSSVRGVASRLGNSYTMNFVVNFLNPKYCEKGFLKDVLEFPLELIMNPNVDNEEFDLRSFNIIKNRIKADIESLKEYPVRYAFRNSLIKLDDEAPSSYVMSGYMDDLEKITPSNLYQTYLEVLKTFKCDIYVCGNLDMDEVVNIISKKFNNKFIKNYDFDLYVKPKARKRPISVIETGDYEQSSLIMIYNMDDFTKYEKNIVVHVYNYLLGGGSITTKLGLYLRENNSLCYSVGSSYHKYDNLELIYAGIDKKNYKLAVRLAKKAVKDMVLGNFTDEDLEETKLALISSVKLNMDNIGGIIANYLFNNLDNIPLWEEKIELLNNVTREDVINVAKKVHLNLIYMLSNGGE